MSKIHAYEVHPFNRRFPLPNYILELEKEATVNVFLQKNNALHFSKLLLLENQCFDMLAIFSYEPIESIATLTAKCNSYYYNMSQGNSQPNEHDNYREFHFTSGSHGYKGMFELTIRIHRYTASGSNVMMEIYLQKDTDANFNEIPKLRMMYTLFLDLAFNQTLEDQSLQSMDIKKSISIQKKWEKISALLFPSNHLHVQPRNYLSEFNLTDGRWAIN